MDAARLIYRGDRAMLATMHAKERVIGPIVERFLGLRLEVADGLNTDAFGTFSRDVERSGSQLEVAKAKIGAVFERTPDLKVGLASEGSFGPHPQVPFCAIGREIVVLIDRSTDLELVGHHATLKTNYSHAVIAEVPDGLAFAERVGFPDHGVIVLGCRDGRPAPMLALTKDAVTWDALGVALGRIIAENGSAFVETDMRAHRNPRRMRAIKRATIDLVRRARSPCPQCERPGYGLTERLPGRPCSDCGEPTHLIRVDVLACAGCGWRVERAVNPATASPASCGQCNP